MGAMKKYLEEHIDDFTDEELLSMGYEEEYIEFLRDCCSTKTNKDEES